ncbi:hypothetical protein ASPCAL01840 [Aspergillus calidoustus]|uniref:U1-type domain-containing protein n=1 Tax=Aspergillus calidoustus TaxID=454130 RepID=A0A0U4ZTC7_ASPCI|nr:hypothetical protein ASPCAL01840 [Aspergillus calidoustus]
MAEYWKSTPKYWCKQCQIYIRDTAFERTQHEATGKHQGNLKRFLRDIHRDNERSQRDAQRAKDEVERLRQSVSGKPGDKAPWKNGASSTPAAPPPRPVSVEERKKQMAQLAEMGVAIPDEYRRDMALAGDWQTVSEKVIRAQDEEETQQSTLGVRKRKHDLDEEEEEAKREAERFVSKGWGSATRRYPGAQEDEDLDALLASTKDAKKAKISGAEAEKGASAKEEDQANEGAPVSEDADQTHLPKEEDTTGDKPSIPPASKEPEEPTVGVVFKKRKPKAMRR